LIQTLRVTAFPIIASNFDYLKDIFGKIRREIGHTHNLKAKIMSKILLFKTLVNNRFAKPRLDDNTNGDLVEAEISSPLKDTVNLKEKNGDNVKEKEINDRIDNDKSNINTSINLDIRQQCNEDNMGGTITSHVSENGKVNYDKISNDTNIELNDNDMIELIAKLMSIIEPNRVNHILLSVVTAFLSCLIIVKDNYLTLIAQSVDIGKNIS